MLTRHVKCVQASPAPARSLLSLGLIAGRAAPRTTRPIVMKIALATVNDRLHQFAKNYAAAVEKDSGGRIKVEIYPASQLGSIQRQAEGVQFGAIQCLIVSARISGRHRRALRGLGGARPCDARWRRASASPPIRRCAS